VKKNGEKDWTTMDKKIVGEEGRKKLTVD